MTAETVALILAIAFAAQTVVVCIVLLRLVPVLREVNELIQKLQDVVVKIDALTDHLKSASGGVKQVEQRIRGVANSVLDQIEPPVRHLVGLVTGVRSTVASLLRRPIAAGNGHPEPTATERGVIR